VSAVPEIWLPAASDKRGSAPTCLNKAAKERQVVSNETVWQLTAYLFIPVIAAVVIAITQPRFMDTLASRRRTLASHIPSRTAL